jgi:hypothetical protein
MGLKDLVRRGKEPLAKGSDNGGLAPGPSGRDLHLRGCLHVAGDPAEVASGPMPGSVSADTALDVHQGTTPGLEMTRADSSGPTDTEVAEHPFTSRQNWAKAYQTLREDPEASGLLDDYLNYLKGLEDSVPHEEH